MQLVKKILFIKLYIQFKKLINSISWRDLTIYFFLDFITFIFFFIISKIHTIYNPEKILCFFLYKIRNLRGFSFYCNKLFFYNVFYVLLTKVSESFMISCLKLDKRYPHILDYIIHIFASCKNASVNKEKKVFKVLATHADHSHTIISPILCPYVFMIEILNSVFCFSPSFYIWTKKNAFDI